MQVEDVRIALLYAGGMPDFLANSLAGLERCGVPLSSVVVGCPDDVAADVGRVLRGRPVEVLRLTDPEGSTRVGHAGYLDFGTRGFNDAMVLKLRLLSHLVDRCDLLVYADLDVSWLRDPRPYLTSVAERFPLAFQTESQGRFPPAICTGFVSLRAGAAAREFLDTVLARDAALAVQGRTTGDQALAQAVLESDPRWLDEVFFLPESLFINGLGRALLPVRTDRLTAGVLDPLVFHANWCVGTEAKREMLCAAGAWWVDETEPEDAAVAAEPGDAAALTVVFPEFDVRGESLARIRRWIDDQCAEPGRYRVTVVSAASGEADAHAITGILRAQDAHICLARPGREADYWSVGAQRATTPWVLCVEGHAIPEPGCIDALLRAIDAHPDAAALNCTVRNPPLHRVSPHMRRWFTTLQSSWAEPSTWPRLHRAAFAVRRDALTSVGGFAPEFGQFTPPLLAADLHRRGMIVRTVPDAVVQHEDSDMTGHRHDTIDYVRGEIRARAERPPHPFEEYFGPSPRSDLANQPARVLRPVSLGLLRASAVHPLRDRHTARVGAALLPVALLPLTVRLRALRLRTRLDERLAVTRLLPGSLRYRVFVRGHARIVRAEHLAWVGSIEPAALDVSGRRGEWSAERLPDGAVLGMHALELVDGRPLRWSHPLVVLRLASGGGPATLTLDTADLRPGLSPDHLTVVVDGHRLAPPDVDVDRGVITILVPPGAPVSTIIVMVTPLPEPGPQGRILGLPLACVAVDHGRGSAIGPSLGST